MKSTLFLIVFCLCSSFVFADQFEDMPLEMMIDKSECIISGKVLEKIETIFSNGEQYEISLIGVNRIIMSNIQLPEKIKVRVYRGSTLYDQIVMNNFRPKLSNKEEAKSEESTEFVSVTPNPANPMTTITYAIANPSRVKLDIYNISGQKVATLVDAPMNAGTHAVTFDGSSLASGVYFYRLESKGFRKSGKMLLVK